MIWIREMKNIFAQCEHQGLGVDVKILCLLNNNIKVFIVCCFKVKLTHILRVQLDGMNTKRKHKSKVSVNATYRFEFHSNLSNLNRHKYT